MYTCIYIYIYTYILFAETLYTELEVIKQIDPSGNGSINYKETPLTKDFFSFLSVVVRPLSVLMHLNGPDQPLLGPLPRVVPLFQGLHLKAMQ